MCNVEGSLGRFMHDQHLRNFNTVSERPFVRGGRPFSGDQVLAPVGRRRDGDHPESGRLDDDSGFIMHLGPSRCQVCPSI